jgi:uncharacterized membrane protein YoaK (UPF0700 family)
MTGKVAEIGEELAQGRTGSALGALCLVGVFLGGAITATALIERAKRRAKARYVAPLLVEAGLLAAFALGAGLRSSSGGNLPLTALLCFAMGLQNALVTKLSGAIIRTTHLTGIVTDIGIELVRLFAWLKSMFGVAGLRHLMRIGGALANGPEWKKLRLHFTVLFSFLAGAITGPSLFLHYGQVAMIAPCFTLLLLAGFDFALGIRSPGEELRASSPAEATTPLN